MGSKVLIDTGFLFALYNQSELIFPDVILPEVTFLFSRYGGITAVIRFLQTLVAIQPHLEPLTNTDIQRASEIMALYSDSKLDFVDCCIMALAERLNIYQICTFDRRDFVIFRPKHIEHLELLP